MGVIFAFGDARNQQPAPGTAPVLVGLLVMAVGMGFGFNAGYAINPARDLGPRLFTAVAGWGGEVFRAGNGWWWVPLVAPPIGAVPGRLRLRRRHRQAPPRALTRSPHQVRLRDPDRAATVACRRWIWVRAPIVC
jgi:hypothetical protein